MKKLFTFFLLLLTIHGLQAQTVVYSENFDEYPAYSITSWDASYTGMVPWQSGVPYQVGGCMPPPGGPMSLDIGTDKVACIVDCGAFNYNNSNVFMATPAINMSGISGAWLQYDSYFTQYTDGTNTERATVEISTDGGTNWTVIQTVPANASLSNFQTWHINLAAYNNMPDVRIGFRYSDDGGWMKGWAVDNVAVVVPAYDDLALLSATPTDTLLGFVAVGQGFVHHAKVYNAGLDTIHSFTLNYMQGTGPVRADVITGVSLPPFSTTDFAHNIPDTVTAKGAFPVTMWVDLPDDGDIHNDTVHTTITGADFIPTKRLVIEDGEGVWDGWSPRTMVYLNGVATAGVSASIISVHHYDPMVYPLYDDFLAGLYDDYVPYILFDRRKHIPIDSFYTYLNVEKQYFGYADISINAVFSPGSLSVTGSIIPAVDLIGDYRYVLVVTEDDVQGTDTTYNQVNNYAGGGLGPMGGYELLANPVPAASMVYNYVARLISPTPVGDYGTLPFHAYSGIPYDYDLSAALDPAWHTDKLKAIVLLINNADSIIVNSNEISAPPPLGVTSPVSTATYAGIYPNPSSDAARVFFNTTRNETVHISMTDMSGRALYQCPVTDFVTGRNEISIPVRQLQSGIYLVNLQFEDGKKTLKLEVIH